MGVVTTIIRLVLNLASIGGSGMIIYGIVESRSGVKKALEISDASVRSLCVLWPHKGEDKHELFTTSSETNCTYGIAAAVESMALAVILTILFIYSLKQKSTDKHTCTVVVEVVLLVCTLIMSVVAVIVISGGFADYCSTVEKFYLEHYNYELQCSTVPVRTLADLEGKNWYYPHDDLNVAQIGTWILVVVWTLHLVFAAINCHAYRRNKRSGDITTTGMNDTATMLADPTVFEAGKDDVTIKA